MPCDSAPERGAAFLERWDGTGYPRGLSGVTEPPSLLPHAEPCENVGASWSQGPFGRARAREARARGARLLERLAPLT